MVEETAPDSSTSMDALPTDTVVPATDAPMDDIPVDEATPPAEPMDAPVGAADAPSDIPSDMPVDNSGLSDMPVDATTAAAAHAANSDPHTIMAQLAEIGGNTIYLMGLSFILGSLFTILILILLDFMRRNQPK